MKVPRGNTRKLILILGDVQTLVSSAIGIAQNDRDIAQMDKLMAALEEAFGLCLEARNMYAPIER